MLHQGQRYDFNAAVALAGGSITLSQTLQLTNVLVNPREMDNGAVVIQLHFTRLWGLLDVDVREQDDLVCQRGPWRLKSPYSRSNVLDPGIAHLEAYWLGRYHSHIAEDRPGVCAVYE